jgi:hypothetical protein
MELIMKMNKKLLVLGATFALAAQFNTVAMAEDVDGDASVVIATALTISVTAAVLNFGTIAVGSTGGGDVDVDEFGALTTSEVPADLAIVDDSNASAGVFDITGANSEAILVSVPATATLTGPGTDMTATLSSIDPTTTDGSGDATLTVYGSLTAAAAQTAGSYSGTYNVTVIYN